MSELCGYAGKILRVDLTSGEISEIPSEQYLPKYLGGRGLAARLYWDEIPSEVGAFDPENRLIIATGPLTGTGALGGGRCEAATKCPAMYPTQSFTTANAGYIGPELKYAGYDAIIVQGKAKSHVYLWICDGKAEVRRAEELWGLTTRQTRENLWKKHDKKAKVACIGPAGENLATSAIISVEVNSAFGKGGMGAVMGSKNLKAIAVRGTGRIKVANPKKLLEINNIRMRFHNIKAGETRVINGKTTVGTSKIRNSPTFASSKLGDEAKQGRVKIGLGGCPGCPLNCHNKAEFTDNSLPSGSVECADTFVWAVPEKMATDGGKLIGRLAWEASMLIDDMGIDNLQVLTVGLLSGLKKLDKNDKYTNMLYGGDWLYQGYLAGIFTEANTGLPWEKFGSQEFLRQLLNIMAYREGFGDILAQGLGPATKYVMEHEEFGSNRKQMEYIYQRVCPKAGRFGNPQERHSYTAPDPMRSIYCAVGDQFGQEPEPGWCGHAEPWYSPGLDTKVIIKWLGTDKIKDPFYWGPEVAKAAIAHEDIAAVTDSLVVCSKLDYGMYPTVIGHHAPNWPEELLVDWEEFIENSPNGGPEYLSAILGVDMTPEEVWKQGEMIVNLVRAIWVRDGYTEGKYDTYWDAIFEEEDAKGNKVTPKDKFENAIGDYYSLRGWKAGVPTRAKLEELDLKDVADELDALGKLPA